MSAIRRRQIPVVAAFPAIGKGSGPMTRDFLLFYGTANSALAKAVAAELGARPGVCDIARYPVVPIAPLIAGAIRRIHAGGSLGELCQDARRSTSRIPHSV